MGGMKSQAAEKALNRHIANSEQKEDEPKKGHIGGLPGLGDSDEFGSEDGMHQNGVDLFVDDHDANGMNVHEAQYSPDGSGQATEATGTSMADDLEIDADLIEPSVELHKLNE